MQDRDVALYRRFLNGDERALEELIALYERGLLRFINSYLHDEALAEDIMQEVFIALYFKRSFKERENASFKTYLYKIARNKSLNEIKKRTRKKEISLELLEEKGGKATLGTQEQGAKSESAVSIENLSENGLEEILEKKQTAILLQEAFKEIKEEYKEVLLLRYFENLSPEEIANITQKKSKQVYNLLSRGKVALKETLIRRGYDYEND
jgi:RNA polymerase sigma-70 factor (ECF subfamily)